MKKLKQVSDFLKNILLFGLLYVAFLLGINDIAIPWSTLFLSVVLFVVAPIVAGWLSRTIITRNKGLDYFENTFMILLQKPRFCFKGRI